jgi:hypothetical protein
MSLKTINEIKKVEQIKHVNSGNNERCKDNLDCISDLKSRTYLISMCEKIRPMFDRFEK